MFSSSNGGACLSIHHKMVLFGAVWLIAILLALSISPPVDAAITDDATGGSCAMFGNWDAATRTCTLVTDIDLQSPYFEPVNGLTIGSDGITLDGNGHMIIGNGYLGGAGVILNGRTGVTIKNITISSFMYGVSVTASSNNVLTNITIDGTAGSIVLVNSDSNQIAGNILNDDFIAIDMANSSGNTISGNTLQNGLVSSLKIDIHSGSNDNVVTANAIIEAETGVLVNGTAGNTVSNNTISCDYWNLTGIELRNASGNTVSGNNIDNCFNAVLLDGADNNDIRGNKLDNFNMWGVALSSSDGNSIEGNDTVSLSLTDSSNNTMIHNNMNELGPFTELSGGLGNLFSLPAPAGGNHWADYDEPAEGCDDNDSDGFCDAPYIFAGGQDDLPWTTPNGWLAGKPVIGISGLTPYWESYAAYEARELSVDFTIANSGSNTAAGARVVGIVSTNSVVISTQLPYAVGDVAAGSVSDVTLRYFVPNGVTRFATTIFVTAKDPLSNSYYYPSPYMGS